MDKKELEVLKNVTLRFFDGYSIEEKTVTIKDGETFKPVKQKVVVLNYRKDKKNIKKDIPKIRKELRIGYYPARWTWNAKSQTKKYTQKSFFGMKYVDGIEKVFNYIFSEPATAVVKEDNPYAKFANEL